MRVAALALMVALSACGDGAETAVPRPAVTPQPIGYPDIEANALYGASCAYGSGTSMAPLVIAFADEAVMKLDGQLVRFQADAESEGAQLGIRTRYLAPGRVLLLALEKEGAPSGYETVNVNGTVRLLDDAGAVLFEANGTAQCGS